MTFTGLPGGVGCARSFAGGGPKGAASEPACVGVKENCEPGFLWMDTRRVALLLTDRPGVFLCITGWIDTGTLRVRTGTVFLVGLEWQQLIRCFGTRRRTPKNRRFGAVFGPQQYGVCEYASLCG